MEKVIEEFSKHIKLLDAKKDCDPELEQTFYSLLDEDMKEAYDRINEQKSEAQFTKSSTTYMQGFRMGMQVAKDVSKNDSDDTPF
ncbi:hypothetical protein HCA63_06865 [Listeria booriae]|uniref:hypothetical protein n=1 Tax=Listeria booriae TaxID=1552123 RepID=UPI0016267B5F|nr:hypothetical protein [Listeria booriae]MBC1888071.1 hypothetical protein [Listeria booriae]